MQHFIHYAIGLVFEQYKKLGHVKLLSLLPFCQSCEGVNTLICLVYECVIVNIAVLPTKVPHYWAIDVTCERIIGCLTQFLE